MLTVLPWLSFMRMPKGKLDQTRGVSLVEILIGTLVVVVASIATLSYFSYALGGVGKAGNRRAALERARERLEQMAVSKITDMTPPNDGLAHPVSCAAGIPCAVVPSDPGETVSVDDLPNLPVQSTVQCIHEVSAGTPLDTCDALVMSAKVWFIPGSTIENAFNRVYLRAVRAQ